MEAKAKSRGLGGGCQGHSSRQDKPGSVGTRIDMGSHVGAQTDVIKLPCAGGGSLVSKSIFLNPEPPKVPPYNPNLDPRQKTTVWSKHLRNAADSSAPLNNSAAVVTLKMLGNPDTKTKRIPSR